MNPVCQINALKKKNISHKELFLKKIAVIGLGGLGSSMAEQLTRMGFTNLLLLDADLVEESNLARQGFLPQDVGKKKGEACLERLLLINPESQTRHLDVYLSDSNINLLAGVDLILDATDNLATRYTINRYAFQQQTPWIYGSAIHSTSSYAAFIPGSTPCFECVYGSHQEEAEVSCSVEGVLIPALMQTVSNQISLALRVLSGVVVPSVIYRTDIWDASFSEFDFSSLKLSSCPGCQTVSTPLLTPYFSMKCSGSAIDVSLKETHLLLPVIETYYELSKQNPYFYEFRLKHKRIVLYPEKRVTFHSHTKEEVKALFDEIYVK